jgi:F-type H+-transporting ATPase subunit b
MQIDWTTFTLEIVNFLALVWILKRFLYAPVLETLSQRRAGVERVLNEAKVTESNALGLKRQFENRLADWEEEKAAARGRFDTELATERVRRMEELAKELTAERERDAAHEAHRREELRQALESRALTQAQRFATILLTRLAGPELESRLTELFIEELAGLADDRLSGLRTALGNHEIRAAVASAFPLDEPQRQQIHAAVAARLGRPLAMDFGEDGRLLAGLRLTIGPWQLNLSLADELRSFAAVADHAG